MKSVLTVKQLNVSFKTYGGTTNVLRGVNFDLKKGETLAIVGESGSGKSVTAKTMMQLLPKQNSIIHDGEVMFEGKNLLQLSEREMRQMRGSKLAMVFQDPMTSLNPTMSIGKQIMEGIREHQTIPKRAAYERAIELIDMVGIPSPRERMKEYPHQFSGGMRQRVVVAIAIASSPEVLIADEPTTALDVTIQAQILDLMKGLQHQLNTSIIIITHDLGVVANMAQRVAVMYGGQIVEIGTVDELFYKPKHPYTWGLLSSMPKLSADRKEPLIPITGSPPDLNHVCAGCSFAPRCPYAMKVCHQFEPELFKVSDTQSSACWLLDDRAPIVESPIETEVN